LFERAEEISSLIRRIEETLKLPNLTEAQTRDIGLIPQRIGSSIKAIREAAIVAANRTVCEPQLVASTERLREEIATANIILDRLLKDPRGIKALARSSYMTQPRRLKPNVVEKPQPACDLGQMKRDHLLLRQGRQFPRERGEARTGESRARNRQVELVPAQ
jgi:hypothetical protein